MKTCIQRFVIAFFYCLSVSHSWSAPLIGLVSQPSGDYRLDSDGIYQLQPENEEQRITTRTDSNASIERFSVALNSESAPLQMQFYESADSGELVIDLSGMAGLTPLTIQKTEFNDSHGAVASGQIKIRIQFEGLNHEFIILGETGALPNLRLTRHRSAQNSASDIVIPIKQWLRPRHVQKRALDDGSADSFDRTGANESDSGSQNDKHSIAVAFSVTFAITATIGEFLWIVGNIKLPKSAPETAEPPLMAARLFSYCIGFGIPLIQELLIRTIYLQVKHKPLEQFWIPACGS